MATCKLTGGVLLATMLALLPATVHAAPAEVAIQEWQVPYPASRPRDPFVDPSGRVWFCGQAGQYLAWLDPESGQFTQYELADGASPHNLIIDDEGMVWYAANTKPYIGKFDPETGDIVKFAMPDGKARDPHTLVFNRNGDIWFTAQQSNYVGRLNTRTGAVDLIRVNVPRARPYGIRLDSSDRPWIALFGTNKLATVDPGTMKMTIHDLPREKARVRRIEITPDDMIWYGDYAKGKLGRFDPATRKVTEWDMPGGDEARPYGSALDDKGVIWLAEDGSPSQLVGFDTATEKFIGSTDIPNAKGAIRHMYFHPLTREIWFGEDTNFLARARVP